MGLYSVGYSYCSINLEKWYYLQCCKLGVTEPQAASDLFATRCCKTEDIGDIDIHAAAACCAGVGCDVAVFLREGDKNITVDVDIAAVRSTCIGGNSAVVAQLDISRLQVNICSSTRYSCAVNTTFGIKSDRICHHIDITSASGSRSLHRHCRNYPPIPHG